MQQKGLAHQRQNALRDHQGVFGLLDVENQRRELIAPEPGQFNVVIRLQWPAYQVSAAHGFSQPVSHNFESLIPSTVTQRVVHVLEAVQVHEQNTKTGPAMARPAHLALNPLYKRLPVGESCQAVKKSQLSDLTFRVHALGDVARQNNKPR